MIGIKHLCLALAQPRVALTNSSSDCKCKGAENGE
jgi:hypothetical protein